MAITTALTEREIIRLVYNEDLNTLQINFLGESLPLFASIDLAASGDVLDLIRVVGLKQEPEKN